MCRRLSNMRVSCRVLAALVPLTVISAAPVCGQDARTAPQDAVASKDEAVRPTGHPLLWMIEGDPPSFLYGTMHVPDERVLALPRVVQEAFERADAFYAEIPMDAATLARAAPRMMLPADQTLQDRLPEKVERRLARFLESRKLDLSLFSRMRVWAVALQLLLVDYMDVMLSRQPLDVALYTRAAAAGKQVGGLETVDEQLSLFEAMTPQEQVELLEKTLHMLEEGDRSGRPYAEQLVEKYLSGDPEDLLRFMYRDMDPDDPFDRKFFKSLLDDRNERMAKRIAARLRESPGTSQFFAIGAAHLAGKRGVLALLKTAGFQPHRRNAEGADTLKNGEKAP